MKSKIKDAVEEILDCQLSTIKFHMEPHSSNSINFVDGYLRGLRFANLITHEEYQQYFFNFTDQVKKIEENGGIEE